MSQRVGPRARRLASVCLISALLLAVVGQYYFDKQRAYMHDAALFYGVASVLFVAAVRLAGIAPMREGAEGVAWWARPAAWVRRHPWRAVLAAVSVCLVLWVASRATRPLSSGEGYTLLAVWAIGVVACLAAAVDPREAWAWLRSLPARVSANVWEAGLVALLLAVSAATRLSSLDHIPYILGGDECSMGYEALEVLRGRLTNPFATGWFSHPTFFFYVQAAALRIARDPIVGLRIVPALAGTLTVPALYLLAREFFSRRVAALAAAYLALYHYAIQYSRLGLNNMVDPFLTVLTFYFLARGLRRQRAAYFALAGVGLGLGQYFYMGSRVVPIMLVAFLGWLVVREPGFWRRHRWHLAVMVGAALITAWPLLLFFARHPQDFMARTTQLGIFQSGWLPREAELLKRSQASLVWEQFLKATLAFHYYPDRSIFYLPGRPLLDLASAVVFTFGLIYGMVHARERRYALFVFWFWAVIIFGGALLENPPSSQRMVLSMVPVSLFVALGISLITEVAERAFAWRRTSAPIVAALAVAFLGAYSVRFYFGPYNESRPYPGLNTEVGHEMGLYLRSLGPEYRYYFFGAPRMFAGFPNVRYLAPDVGGEDVAKPLTGAPTFVKPEKRPVFIFLPERSGELQQVRLSFPAGKVREFRQQPSGSLLFVAYEPSG